MVRKKRTTTKAAIPTVKAPVVAEKIEAVGKNYVVVDYPQEGEIVTTPSYTLRVSTSAVENVQISIDGRPFESMRESVGFWWYDWSAYGAGAHTVISRILVGKRPQKSKARSFTVLI